MTKRILLFLLVGLIAAEVGLRIYASANDLGPGELGGRTRTGDAGGGKLSTVDLLRPSRNEEIVYELRPGIYGLLSGQFVQINELGLRGRERQVEKPAGTFRIVGLGDARMFGSGVAEGQTYLDLLERRLNVGPESDTRYEVLSFATPGFNTAQEVAILEHWALEFDPDLVIVHFVGDDLGAPRFLPTEAAPKRGSVSYLFELISASLAGAGVEADGPTLERASEARKERRQWLGREGVESSLEKLALLMGDRPVIFLMLGDDGDDRAAVRDAAGRLDFHYLNALPGFRDHLVAQQVELTRENWRRAFFLRGDNPTPLAHRLYANVLFDRLVELELATPPAQP